MQLSCMLKLMSFQTVFKFEQYLSYKMSYREYESKECNHEGSDLQLDTSELPTDRTPTMWQEVKRGT